MILSDLLGFWPLTSRKMNFFGVWSWPVKYPFLVEDIFLLICPCCFSIILSKLVLKTKYMCAETYKWQLLYRVKGWVFSIAPSLTHKKMVLPLYFPFLLFIYHEFVISERLWADSSWRLRIYLSLEYIGSQSNGKAAFLHALLDPNETGPFLRTRNEAHFPQSVQSPASLLTM